MTVYPFTVRPLSEEEGGGYVAEAIELNGCIADGEAIEEAVHNLEDTVNSWIRTAQELAKRSIILKHRRNETRMHEEKKKPCLNF